MLPRYANTHTESSGTGLQTTRLREDARAIIADASAAATTRCVIFTGSGSTGAIDKLVGILNLRIPADLDRRYGFSAQIPAAERPVVFIGPFEHHSNELPWRESIADVVTIPEDADGHIDVERLRAELVRYADRPLKIGSFSAASNVTGIMTDTHAIAMLLHEHGALSVWDYAAAAPYVDIDMAGDAALPGSAQGRRGALAAQVHRRSRHARRPGRPPRAAHQLRARGRGRRHRRLREPGRAPLPRPTPCTARRPARRRSSSRSAPGWCSTSSAASAPTSSAPTSTTSCAAPSPRGREHPTIDVLGNREAERLSIVSFTVRRPGGRYLHHNLVVAILNDLFGIQSRGGCSCAGPYGHRLLGIDLERSHEFEREITHGCEGIKPGWVRVNFNYFISDEVFRYVVQAVGMVADHGWKLVPEYRFDLASGRWRHKDGAVEPPLRLSQLHYEDGVLTYPRHDDRAPESDLAIYLEQAHDLMAALPDPGDDVHAGAVSDDFEHLRWFELPAVCLG